MMKNRRIWRILVSVVFVCGCGSGAIREKPSDHVIRILPLGDSITQGGKRDREEYTYRWPLFCMLVDNGVKFDFIGSRNTGLQEDAVWPSEYKGIPFDPDHEGYYGIKTARMLEKLPEAIPHWAGPPDIVLIHLGTNDQGASDHRKAVADPLREIITLLRRQNPKVVILLGHLNFNASKGASAIRPLVEELAREMSTDQSAVITVHHYEGWHERPREDESDTFDWAHPNPKGQKKMAEKWFEAMRPFLEKNR
jgi:hypothetical protein